MLPMEEIRKIVSHETKTGNDFRDKLFNSFSSIGLILGLVVYTLTLGIVFGFVTMTGVGIIKMIQCFKSKKQDNNSDKELL